MSSSPPIKKSVLAPTLKNGYALFPIDGGPAKVVTGIRTTDTTLTYASDGHSIYVMSNQKLPIHVEKVDLTNGQRTSWKLINPADPAGMLDLSSILITPDGNSYVYTYRRVLSDIYLAAGLL